MITIEQLLESVDLVFEPRWITKDEDGIVTIFCHKPQTYEGRWATTVAASPMACFECLKLAEFENKHWTECIYEVPRKVIGKIEKIKFITSFDILENYTGNQTVSAIGGRELADKINELVVAVNELKGANNE